MIDPSLYRRAPLRRSSKPLKRSRPRQRRLKGTSLYQRPVGVIPLQTRAALKLRAKERCERKGCGKWCPNGDAHHVQLRSAGGSDDLSNLLWLDRACHSWAHEHPKLAAKEGLIRPVMKR